MRATASASVRASAQPAVSAADKAASAAMSVRARTESVKDEIAKVAPA